MPAGLNRLIEALSPALRAQLLSAAKVVDLPPRASLYEPFETLQCLYLLTSGFASIAVSGADGGSAEIGMVGSEGIIGSSALLGGHPPVAHCFMQTQGVAFRIMTPDMRRLFDSSSELREQVLQVTQQQTLMVDQIAACNKLHLASERLARWLLTAADRLETESVRLTQESLSQMLGTRRTTVALVAGTLQRDGLIRYRRGVVQIINRPGLEEAACDCYRIVCQLSKPYDATATRQ
jgi:CRP-like cAMP-binding protein